MIVVFDIDGTLANLDHRLDYIRTKPKNWVAFNTGVINDEPIYPVINILESLYYDHDTILLASGRSDDTREDTEKWLQVNVGVPHDKLYMRKAGDYRDDTIVKSEILDQIIEEYGMPDIVFDDRPKVVQMWRDRGVFTVSVYQGTEDF